MRWIFQINANIKVAEIAGRNIYFFISSKMIVFAKCFVRRWSNGGSPPTEDPVPFLLRLSITILYDQHHWEQDSWLSFKTFLILFWVDTPKLETLLFSKAYLRKRYYLFYSFPLGFFTLYTIWLNICARVEFTLSSLMSFNQRELFSRN